jgi:hypothetical protein
MSRRLAAAFAIVAVLASAAAVWAFAVSDSEPNQGERGARPPPPQETQPATAVAPPEPAKPPTRRFTISVSGDLLIHQPLLDRALANGGGSVYDFSPFFEPVERYVRGADLAFCHLETPLGPGPPTTYPIFNTPTELAASIKRSGWDACSTASNHSLDGGQAGIDSTAKALDSQHIIHTGSFQSAKRADEPTIVRVAGTRVGLVAYTDATNGLPAPTAWSVNEYAAADPKAGAKAIIADARAARDAGAEAVIVNVHWGDEYAAEPNASQLEVAERLTEAKVVTAVVGQGPHVVQSIRRMNGKFVVFSEGNLVSNQSAAVGQPAGTQDGLIALLRMRARGDRVSARRVEYVPTWVRPGDYAVLPADPESDPANASALRASRERTTAVVGSQDQIEPAR